MRKLGEIKIGSTKIVVRELTVAQVEANFTMLESQVEPSALDWLFGDDYMPQSILEEIIERPVAEILTEDMAPSELEPLYKEALRINPFLGKALARMRRIADQMMKLDLEKLLHGSESAPSTLSKEGTGESGNTASPSSLIPSKN